MRVSLLSLCGCDTVLRIVLGLNARRLSFLCVLSIIHSMRGVQAIVPCTVPERHGQRLVLSHGTLGGSGGLRLPLESAVVVDACACPGACSWCVSAESAEGERNSCGILHLTMRAPNNITLPLWWAPAHSRIPLVGAHGILVPLGCPHSQPQSSPQLSL